MRRRTAWLGGLAALATVAGAGVGVWRERRSADPGAALWSLRFDRPDGRELRVADLRGKPLLVNFWATWCPPCVAELPLLDGFARGQPGWQVLGLAADNVPAVREFLLKRPVGFPIGMAGLEGVALSRRLGNVGGALPFTLVFDQSGRLTSRKLGALQAADLAAWATSVR